VRIAGSGELAAAVWEMLADTLEAYRDSPSAAEWLGYHMTRFSEPPRIAITGPAGCGKSTLVNAVVGDRVAPVEAARSQVLTWYSAADEPQATVYTPDDTAHEVPVDRLGVDLQRWQRDEISRVAVQWPADCLRDATLIDTPSDATVSDEADAVIHLVRNVDDAALAPLYAAQDSPVARAAPIGTVLVLSRADEIGAGRADALSSARLIARRHDRSARLRGLCQQVVAVAGLVGYAGSTLTGREYAQLRELAAADRSALDELLLSTDRFLRAGANTPAGPEARRALLDRFGLFGVRLATALIRGGCDTAEKLSAQLVRRSGLGDLRESIDRDLTSRAEVLKARSALHAIERLLGTQPRAQARRIAVDLEQVLASAHEFRELRVLTALRTGRTPLPADLAAEARRLLGGDGTGIRQRLGVDYPVTEARLRAAAAESLARWQDQATNPVLGREQRRAAAAVVRSCEGMLIRLTT
jgi:energy-coupling factor transporter ATP-binding protein EcfA2